MKRRSLSCGLFALCGLLILALANPSLGQRREHTLRAAQDNGCNLRFGGKDGARKRVKLRSPDLDYSFHNGGRAISIADWFAFVCPLDVNVPTTRRGIPTTVPMEMEKVKIKIRAFVLAMKKDPDNDLHVQLGETARSYSQPQIIIEIPPGDDYCEARSQMMELFRADGGTRLSGHIFRQPPVVEVTGYLFLDAVHSRRGRTDFCTQNGGRGMKNGLSVSPVRGTWELHPVIRLVPVTQ